MEPDLHVVYSLFFFFNVEPSPKGLDLIDLVKSSYAHDFGDAKYYVTQGTLGY